jgi:acetylornithine deacetylase
MNKDEEKMAISDWVDENREICIDFLSELVRIPSENHTVYGDEKKVQECIAEHMKKQGLCIDMFTPDDIPEVKASPGYLSGRNYTDRPDVIGIKKGIKGLKKVMILAHADTVLTGNPDSWLDRNPFSGKIEDGHVCGRGSSDDKACIAAMIMASRAMFENNIFLNNDLILSSVVDEEYGGSNGALAAVIKYPSNYYINADGVAGYVAPVSVSGGRFRIDITTKGKNISARNCADAVMEMYYELNDLERIKTEEFRNNRLFSAGGINKDIYKIMEVQVGDENDYTANNHGVIKGSIHSVTGREETKRQIEKIIDKAYDKMDKDKVNRPVLSFTRRFFNGARNDPDGLLTRTFASNIKTVTGHEAVVGASVISDVAIVSEYGNGEESTCVGVSAMTWDEPGGCHQVNEFQNIKDYLDFIKILADTLIDID